MGASVEVSSLAPESPSSIRPRFSVSMSKSEELLCGYQYDETPVSNQSQMLKYLPLGDSFAWASWK